MSGGGAVLVHDAGLLGLLHAWLTGLPGEQFQTALPLVRRTFSRFTGPERGQIGQSVARLGAAAGAGANAAGGGAGRGAAVATSWTIDEARARPAVALAARLLGIAEGKTP